MKKLFLLCFMLLVCSLSFGQQTIVTSVSGTGCSKGVNVAGQGIVGISITGSWSGTIQPEIAVADDPPQNTAVIPYGSTTTQGTITGNGTFQSTSVAGATVFVLCGNTVTGTATVKMVPAQQSAGGKGGGGGTNNPGGSVGSVQFNSGGAFGGFVVGGDGTLNTGTGNLVVTKTNGTSFGTFATANAATPPAIGNTTPASGAFTTLSATSTVSGAGFTALFASPPPIGNTAANSGAFTTLVGTTINATTGFEIGGTAPLNHCLVGNGTNYVDSTSCGSGAFPSGNGIAGNINNTPTISQEFLPTINILLFFTNNYPTYAQAQSQDFGAVLNAAFTAATPTGACVDVSGLNFLNAPSIAIYPMTTNPFTGLTSNTYVPCVIGGNFQLVTSATISTPGGSIKVAGNAPGGIGGTGLVIQPCNTTGNCTVGTVTVNQFPTSAGCAVSGGLDCYATGSPSSGTLSTYNTGTVTYTTGSKTVTGAGTTWTAAMVGGTFVSACGTVSLAACTVGSTSLYTTGRIVAVGSNTSLTLDANFVGNVPSSSGVAGQSYVIFLPNTSVVWCAACLGNNLQKSFTGQEIDNLAIDLNGISGVGYLAKGAQEGSVLNNYACFNSFGLPSGLTAGGACLVWDQSVRESGATGGSAANQTFLGHFSVHDGRMGVGAAGAGGANAFGAVIEGFSRMDGSVSASQANGASDWNFQAIIGGSGTSRYQDAIYLDGFTGMEIHGTHFEGVINDDINVGAVNPVYNVGIYHVTSSGLLGNCAIEFHSGTSGNQIHGVSRPTGGCLAEDDNVPTPTLATSSSGTQSSWTYGEYVQASNNGSGVVTSGSIQSLSDGTHAGILSLSGNTTVPASFPTNSFGWLGPNSASFTSYFFQPSATAPAALGPILAGATASNVSAVTYGTITGNTTSFGTTSGTLISGNCVQSDANHNLVDAGAVCGGSGTNINVFTSQPNVGAAYGMGTVGQTNCAAQYLPNPGVFNNVGINVTTLDNTNNYEFGIYTGNASSTITLACHTTAAPLGASTGNKAFALSASCTLPAGRVYLCFGQAAGTATGQISEGYGTDMLLVETNSASTSFFPATFTSPADSAAVTKINHASGGFKGIFFDLLP